METIRACAQMYPGEFLALCVTAAILIPLSAFLMVAVIMTLFEK